MLGFPVRPRKALREVYLVPFEAAVQAGCMAVMTGYNRVNGTFCSENRFLLQEILRKEWGFRGCVMSDWTGTHSVWGSLEAGLDLEMPEAPSMFYKDRLSRLFHGDPDGLAEMTKPRALAVLRVMARLGWDVVWRCALCQVLAAFLAPLCGCEASNRACRLRPRQTRRIHQSCGSCWRWPPPNRLCFSRTDPAHRQMGRCRLAVDLWPYSGPVAVA